MSRHGSYRREFLRSSAVTAAAIAVAARSPWARGASEGEGAVKAATPLERRRFGKTDMDVAVLGFGAAEIGYQATDPAIVDRLLNAALDAGLNVIDTAECYAESETLIGNAIGKRRKDYHLFTKCGHWTKAGRGSDWSKSGILDSIERSLKRLKTDAVDLVQLHSCSLEELKKGECIEALEQAKKDGKARYIGYSGDREGARFAVESGRFDALQTSVNICDQEAIELTLPLAKEKGMGVIAKRPIANAVWRDEQEPAPDAYHLEYWKRLQELKFDFANGEAKNKEGDESPAAIAMRFTAMQPGVHVLIVGTTKPERWQQNADLMRAGALPKATADSIRARWKAVAKSDWTGQT